MPRKDIDELRALNVPWITKDGYLDPARLPIEVTLAEAVGNDAEKFRNACRVLAMMASGGRIEAGIFLCGLLRHCGDDLRKKESVAEALGGVRTRASAQTLFEELERTESSNTTRVYINAVLKALRGFPPELVRDRFEGLMSDPKWSYKMKQKFEDILYGIEFDIRRRKAYQAGDADPSL